MSKDNKEVMRRYYEEFWNEKNLSLLEELVSPEYVNHSPFVPGPAEGRESVAVAMQAVWAAFPDLRYTIEDQIAEGDRVVTRTTVRGTHRGELRGLPPTGRHVNVSMISIERIVNERIVEHWRLLDELGMLQQLGVMPAP